MEFSILGLLLFCLGASGSLLRAADEPNLPWYIGIPALLLIYYPATIYWVQRQNSPAAVVIQYAPPAGISPAEMRYVLRGEFDDQGVAAAIVNLAARGLVRFKGVDKDYAVSQTEAVVPLDLPPDELAAYRFMFQLQNRPKSVAEDATTSRMEPSPGSFLLSSFTEQTFILLSAAVKKSLKAHAEPKYFTANIRYIAPAAILSLFLIFVRVQHPAVALMAGAGFTVAVLAVKHPEELFGLRRIDSTGNSAGITAIFLMLCVGALTALNEGSLPFLISLLVVIFLNAFMAPRLRGRTLLGNECVGQIHGYREFLKQAELDKLERMKGPDWKPNEDTAHLAYALALDLGNAWQDYLTHAGYWKNVPATGKSAVQTRKPPALPPLVTPDAWLALALFMLVLAGSIVLLHHVGQATERSPTVGSSESLAAYGAIGVLVLFVVLAIRRR